MSELRKEFEKIAYKNKWNINKDPHDFYVDDFVNGAWWAFEEQQAKIDELQKRVDELKGNVNNALSFYNYAKSDVNIGMIKMKQLLRGEE